MAETKATGSNPPGNHAGDRAGGQSARGLPDRPPTRGQTLSICLLLFGLVLTVFFSSLRNDFLYWYGDDPLYVLENKHVNSGLSMDNLRWALCSTENSNWHPVTWASHMVDVEIYGLKAWGHHLTSVLLHALNAALVFLFLRRITGATWRSLAVALLFAIHPLRVESVAWVSERKDVLSGFFWLGTLLIYARYVKERAGRKRTLLYLLALASFGLGLMSKGMLVTLPFVLLLLDYWPFHRWTTTGEGDAGIGKTLTRSLPLLMEKIPFFLLVTVTSALTVASQKSWGFVKTLHAYSVEARLENGLVSYLRYLGKMFWPVDLCNFYPHPGDWPTAIVLLAGAVVIGVSIMALCFYRKWPAIATGWLWYLGTLMPVIGIIQVGDQSMADRYTYIPMIGVLIMLVWGIDALAAGRIAQPITRMILLLAVSVPLVFLTQKQISYFKDSVTLWRHAVAVTGKHGLAQYALGLGLCEQGQVEEGIRELKDILTVKPDWVDVHANLGGALLKEGRLEEAMTHCLEALRLEPNRAVVHLRLGTVYRMQGQTDRALAHYTKTLELDGENSPAYYFLGLTLLDKNQTTEAILAFKEVIKRNPEESPAHYALGAALGKTGEAVESMHHLEEALRLDPDCAEAHNELAIALGKAGKLDAAIKHLQQALKANPQFAQAHNNLGYALQQQGRRGEAVKHFEEALRIDPNFAAARQNLKAARAPDAP